MVYDIVAVPLKLADGVKLTSPVEVFNIQIPFEVVKVVC